MKSNNPRIERLKEMLNLEEKRSRLQSELDEVLSRLGSLKSRLFDSGTTASKASTRPSAAAAPSQAAAKKPGGKTRRGALKEQIMSALEAAGNAGVHVKELAQALGTKAVNIHSWFHSTSKRNPAIKKITGGHYRLAGGGARAASPAQANGKSPAARKAPGKARKAAKTQGQRGALSANILGEMQKAGRQGITVKELSEKLGANYKNISIWFSTTGKKNPSVKKVSPARYRFAA